MRNPRPLIDVFADPIKETPMLNVTDAAVRLDCVACGAVAHDPCRSRSGKPRGPHAPRVYVAAYLVKHHPDLIPAETQRDRLATVLGGYDKADAALAVMTDDN